MPSMWTWPRIFYEHIIKNDAKRAIVEHIYSDDYECLGKYASEIISFIKRMQTIPPFEPNPVPRPKPTSPFEPNPVESAWPSG